VSDNKGRDGAVPSVSDIAHDEVVARVDHLARTIARARVTAQAGGDEQGKWLVQLAILTAIRRAADALAAHAAARAAGHGAKYPALARAAGMSRQNARVRWPGLVAKSAPPGN
jgi:hypothetical protein